MIYIFPNLNVLVCTVIASVEDDWLANTFFTCILITLGDIFYAAFNSVCHSDQSIRAMSLSKPVLRPVFESMC